MRIEIIKNGEVDWDNSICPKCKNPDASRMCPIGMSRTMCADCNIWFDVKMHDCEVRMADSKEELQEQWNQVMERIKCWLYDCGENKKYD